jgi:hypothetical protein
MGQKINALALRLVKNKNWYNSSHYLPFNYASNVNKDLQIVKFLKGFLSYLGINHHLVNIQRLKNKINVSIILYNRDYLFRYVPGAFKNLKGLSGRKVGRLLRGKNKVKKKLKKNNYSLSLKGFNLYISRR